MKKEVQEVVGFHFQVIPLQEAKSLAISGNGNYSDLKAKILEQIPNLKEDESFAFGLPKGEVSEAQWRAICMTITSTLKKAKLPWRLTYSGVKRLFLCIPLTTPRNYKDYKSVKSNTPPLQQTIETLHKTCCKLWNLTEDEFMKNPDYRLYRKAMQYVGKKTLGLSLKELGAHFGLTAGGVSFNIRHIRDRDEAAVNELMKVVQEGKHV